MSVIVTNKSTLEARVTGLQNASNGFDLQALRFADDESTITANNTAKSTFNDSVQGHSSLGNILNTSATQLHTIGNRFVSVDGSGAGSLTQHTNT